jgi:hypothetical protein
MQVRHVLAAVALSAAASLSQAQPATPPIPYDLPQVDCAAPRGLDQRRTCEAARQGVVVLRRYAHATRNIYAALPAQYLSTAQEAERRQAQAAEASDTKVAQAKP